MDSLINLTIYCLARKLLTGVMKKQLYCSRLKGWFQKLLHKSHAMRKQLDFYIYTYIYILVPLKFQWFFFKKKKPPFCFPHLKLCICTISTKKEPICSENISSGMFSYSCPGKSSGCWLTTHPGTFLP